MTTRGYIYVQAPMWHGVAYKRLCGMDAYHPLSVTLPKATMGSPAVSPGTSHESLFG